MEERKPTLSDDRMEDIAGADYSTYGCAEQVRDFYENLITTGKLRVVVEVGINEDGDCTLCGWDSDARYPFSKCCPGCGNPIKE